MYIRGLVPWNFAELVEAVPIGAVSGPMLYAFRVEGISVNISLRMMLAFL